MAARKTAVEPDIEPPIDTGLTGKDMGVPVLSVVHSSSEHCKRGRAKFGDLIIAMNSEDTEAQVVFTGGQPPITVHMVAPVQQWYAMGYNKGDGKWDLDGTPRMQWDGNMSPPMPANAELNHLYTLLVPEYSTDMPVHFYVKGTSLKAMRGLVNKVNVGASQGVYPFTFAFGMATEYHKAGTNDWYTPLITLVEPDAANVATAKRFYAELAVTSQRQIAAADTSDDDADSPTF